MKRIDKARSRRGAVMPLFGFLLPVIFILCGLAINIAYMRLTKTEMKIATDAASHAAGRSMSIDQNTDDAMANARRVAALNYVAGAPLTLTLVADDSTVFGSTTRADNGFGRYEFHEESKEEVDDGTAFATSVRVYGTMEVPLLIRAIPGVSSFTTSIYSTATQVDRDIALVLDRSGSMLYYKDDTALTAGLQALLDNVDLIPTGYWEEQEIQVEVEVEVEVVVGQETTTTDAWTHVYYSWWVITNSNNYYLVNYPHRFNYTPIETTTDITETQTVTQMQTQYVDVWVEDGFTTQPNPLITQQEFNDATHSGLYPREYSQNVVDQLYDTAATKDEVTLDMYEYAAHWRANDTGDTGDAPPHSRWALLEEGVDAFLTVLDSTDQEEQVSLVTFSSSSSQETTLLKNFDDIRAELADINPYGGTAIHLGLETGLPPIINDPAARQFASKTIIVLTDGQNNDQNVDLGTTVTNLIDGQNITVHAMTFTPGADKTAMEAVATAGHGKHYHADTGDVLVTHFREIANNLPTILTE